MKDFDLKLNFASWIVDLFEKNGLLLEASELIAFGRSSTGRRYSDCRLGSLNY